MSPAPKTAPVRAEVEIEDSPAIAATLGGFIDESGLAAEVRERNPNYGPHRPHPFRGYVMRVMAAAGVRDARANREAASIVCGIVASLPDLPDREEILDGGKTEYDLQVERTASTAESQVDSPIVMTVTARKLTRAALELRYADPEGVLGRSTEGREGAWVNDPMPVA